MRRPLLSHWLPKAPGRGARSGLGVRPQLTGLEGRETPATFTWQGPSGGVWSDPANWAENAVPGAGDDLLFNKSSGATSTVNDIAVDTAFKSITFNAGRFTLTGNGLQLTNGIVYDFGAGSSAVSNVIDLPVTFTGNQTVQAAQANNLLAFGPSSNLVLAGNVTFDATVKGAQIGVGGQNGISGGKGNIIKVGAGDLVLGTANGYIGTVFAREGTLTLASPTIGSLPAPPITGDLVIGDGDVKNGTAVVSLSQPDQVFDSAGVTVLADGVFTLNGKGETVGTLSVAGNVDGAGRVDTGAGALRVTGTATATTALTLDGGQITGAALGSLVLGGDVQSMANAAGRTSSIAVPVDFNGGTRTFTVAGGAASPHLLVSQPIGNGTGFVKSGTGTLQLNAAIDRTAFTGPVTITAGVLALNVPLGGPTGNTPVPALPPNVTVGTGTGAARTARLVPLANRQLDGVTVTLASDGYFDTNGTTQQIAGLGGDGGDVSLGAAAGVDLQVGGSDATSIYAGTVSGAGRLVKIGKGTLTLLGDSTLTNPSVEGLVVTDGTLIVNGTIGGTGNGVQVGDDLINAAGSPSLGGIGTVGAVRLQSTVSQGGALLSPTLDPGTTTTGVGRLTTDTVTVAGSKLFGGQTVWGFQLNGDQPGTGFDQVVTAAAAPVLQRNAGTTTEVRSVLRVRVSDTYNVPAGATYVIVDNRTLPPGSGQTLPQVSGTFYVEGANNTLISLFEGARFTDLSGRKTFQITYKGGDGNDVEIMEVSAPTVTITRLTPTPSDQWPAQFEVRFSAPVNGFADDDVRFTGDVFGVPLVAGVTPSTNPNDRAGQVYVVSVADGEYEGTFGIRIDPGAVTSPAGSSNQIGVTPTAELAEIDTKPPTVVLTSDPAVAVTNTGAVGFTAVFSEKVQDFDVSDIQATGGPVSITDFVANADGQTFTFVVRQVAEGPFTIVIPAGVARDIIDKAGLLGNPNLASNVVAGSFDKTRPSAVITLAPGQASPTNGAGVFRITFSERITDATFTQADIAFDGSSPFPNALLASLTNVTPANSPVSIYDVTVTGMTGTGTVRVSLPANTVADVAGNLNTGPAVTDTDLIFDGVAPSVTVSTALPLPTNQGRVPVTVAFSEPVTGFTAADLTIQGANFVGPLATTDNKTFTFEIASLATDGPFQVSVVAGAAADAAGNLNVASNALTGAFDRTGPTVTLSGEKLVTNQPTATLSARFSEKVAGLPVGAVAVTGGTVAGVAADPADTTGRTYTITIARTADGPFAVSIPANGVADLAGNLNPSGSKVVNGAFDTVGPRASITPQAAALINVGPAVFRVVFNESIDPATFTPDDLILANSTVGGTLAATVQVDDAALPANSVFFVRVDGMAGVGNVVLGLKANSVTDVAGNTNPAAAQTATPIAFDGVAPTATLSTTFPAATNAEGVLFTVTFSEPVTGFGPGNISASTGLVTEFVARPGGAVYTFTLSRIEDGAFSVVIPANQARDAAQNGNLASNTLAGVFDTTAPRATITGLTPTPTNASAVAARLVFTESVPGLQASDLAVAGGRIADFAAGADGVTYTFSIVRSADGEFAVTLPAGAVTDPAGNLNVSSNTLLGVFDTAGPTGTAGSVQPVSGTPVRLTVTFNEPLASVGALTPAGVTIGGTANPTAVVVNPTTDPRVYLLTVTGMSKAGTVTAAVKPGSVTDAAGNPTPGVSAGVARYSPSATPGNPKGVAVGSDAGQVGFVRYASVSGSVPEPLGPFGDRFSGGVRVAQADFNGDGVLDTVVTTGPGIVPYVTIYDGVTHEVIFDEQPFERGFTGGAFVAAGDLNGDGLPEVIVSPDIGGGPRVRVLSPSPLTPGSSKLGFTVIADFFGIDDPGFRGGARAAVGDFNADGLGDLVVAAGAGGGPRVAVWDGASLGGGRFGRRVFADLFIFEQGLRNGAYVAAGDVNGDGYADLISGGGPGGGPRVRVLSGRDLLDGLKERSLANFYAGDTFDRGGIRVAAQDVDGDGVVDIITGDGAGAGNRVRGFSGLSISSVGAPTQLLEATPFDDFDGGVFVG